MSCNKTPKIIIVPLRKQRLPRLDTPPSEASDPDLSDTQPHKRTFFKKRRGRGSGGRRRGGGGGVSSREGVHLEAELWENHIQSKRNCQFLKKEWKSNSSGWREAPTVKVWGKSCKDAQN